MGGDAMKIHVVYDAKGEVIATGVPLPPAYDFSGPRSGPMALEEQHVGEMEVPSELAHLSFTEVSQRLQVDTKQGPHRLKAKGS
jgi:hypothetical protein